MKRRKALSDDDENIAPATEQPPDEPADEDPRARRLGKRAFRRKKGARDFRRAIRGANAARRNARGALNAMPPAIARARAKVQTDFPGVVNACHCDITSRDGSAR